MKLQIIIASTRPTRSADKVAPWVIERAKAHPDFDVEVLDLRDWPLPFFQEHFGTLGNPQDPTYSEPIVKQWNQKIKEGEAYLFVTAEYNHGMLGVLKNAIDSVWFSYGFRNKPAAFVGYSVGLSAGVRAIEQLAQVTIECEMMPLRSTVIIPSVLSAFDDQGKPLNKGSEVAMTVLLDDLAWFGQVLKDARAKGELRPPIMRFYEAMNA